MEVVRNCHVPNCNGLHNIVFVGNRAVISVNEFYKLVRHWEKMSKTYVEKNAKEQRSIVYLTRLNFVKMLKESVLKRNRDQRKTIKLFKMELVRQCQHNICMNNWCFNIFKKKLQWKFSKDGYQTLFL